MAKIPRQTAGERLTAAAPGTSSRTSWSYCVTLPAPPTWSTSWTPSSAVRA